MCWVVLEVTVGSSNFPRRLHPKVLKGLSGFNAWQATSPGWTRGSALQPRYKRVRFVQEHEPMARKVGTQPKNQLGYWVLPEDGEVQPFSERF